MKFGFNLIDNVINIFRIAERNGVSNAHRIYENYWLINFKINQLL